MVHYAQCVCICYYCCMRSGDINLGMNCLMCLPMSSAHYSKSRCCFIHNLIWPDVRTTRIHVYQLIPAHTQQTQLTSGHSMCLAQAMQHFNAALVLHLQGDSNFVGHFYNVQCYVDMCTSVSMLYSV